MNKKSKKIIAVLVAGLMLVMTFAEVPAVFAEEGDAEQPVVTEPAEEQGEDLLEAPTENEEEIPQVIVDPDTEQEEPAVEETEDPEDVEQEPEEDEAGLKLEETTPTKEPLVIGETTIYPRLYIKVDQPYYKNYNGNITVKLDLRWCKYYSPDKTKAKTDPERDPRAEDQYQALVDDGWEFTYSILKKDGTPVHENLPYDQVINFEGQKLKLGKSPASYYMAIKAVRGEEVVEASSRTRYIAFTFPSAPKSVKTKVNNKNNNVTITWKKDSKATEYCIFRSTNGKISSKPIARTKKNVAKYVDKGLAGGKTYTYFVKTVKEIATGGSTPLVVSGKSKAAKAKVTKVYLTDSIRPIRWIAKVNYDATLYSSAACSSSVGSLDKGDKVYVVAKSPKKIPQGAHPSKFQIELKNKDGKVVKKGWVKYGPIRAVKGEVAYSPKKKKGLDWTAEKKEKFVNKKKYSSPTKYLCWVNTYTQRVNIFKGKKGHWKLYKSYRVTSGAFYHLTVLSAKQTIHRRMIKRTRVFVGSKTGRTYYMRYLSFFSKGNSFHSQCWATAGNRQINRVNANLQPGTKGCMRMHLDEAKWIYTHIPMRTRVVTY